MDGGGAQLRRAYRDVFVGGRLVRFQQLFPSKPKSANF